MSNSPSNQVFFRDFCEPPTDVIIFIRSIVHHSLIDDQQPIEHVVYAGSAVVIVGGIAALDLYSLGAGAGVLVFPWDHVTNLYVYTRGIG